MKLNEFFSTKKGAKILFILFGTGSIIWFLIRVIPKPSRATYPCMRASYPVMSAFVVYIIGMVSSVFLFRKNLAKYAMVIALLVSVFFAFKSGTDDSNATAPLVLKSYSYYTDQANQPVGVAKGIFPGRVVWVHNPALTNENITHAYNTTNLNNSDVWYMDKNCNQAISDSMLVSAIRRISGKYNIKEAWDELFKYFNNSQGRGMVGYTKGEKIVVKLNTTNAGNSTAEFYSLRQKWQIPNNKLDRMDSSPQLGLAILNQLINVVGVDQQDIWIGDFYRNLRDEYYLKFKAIYPNVHYMDGGKVALTTNKREATATSAEQLMKFSDKKFTSTLPQPLLDATYFINSACLKSHNEGGITMCAKMHQGSICNTITQTYRDDNNVLQTITANTAASQSAQFMHYSLPANNPTENSYRHMVDYMGHKELGGKTLLYIVDATWAGRSWDGIIEKWQIAPFNNDFPSSFFVSLDPVAIESVGFDLLLAEYRNKDASIQYPFMQGADDYLKQAADPTKWPTGIVYDPEGDGTPIGSLGVYEHWNNLTDRQYSRNLKTGSGIELVYYKTLESDNYQNEFTAIENIAGINFRIYPTAFNSNLHIEIANNERINMTLYTLNGKQLFQQTFNGRFSWNGMTDAGEMLKKGFYIVHLKDANSHRTITTCKVVKI